MAVLAHTFSNDDPQELHSNSGPAPEGVTNQIYSRTQNITTYKTCPSIQVDLSVIGSQTWDVEGHQFTVSVRDSVDDYVKLMKEIFDFPLIKSLISGSADQAALNIVANAMHGGEIFTY